MQAMGRAGEISDGIEELIEGRVISRRGLLGGMAAAAVPASVEEMLSLEERVELAAEVLAMSMKALHGGECIVRVSHEHGYVAVARDFS
ncbi:hypothetical protein [Mesorhizobium xinjiangense]|uniref:hypothetical protein n=1 Tax=Mesorhizobium xinjiangense TaxID=2678685 RepID=UPI0012ED42ED|nr:hypothetical protein [Mesorhizobium xinjiangense]